MTISNLIKKRPSGDNAIASLAIPAIQPNGGGATVARIATVAIANPREGNPIPEGGGTYPEATSSWWRIHFPDRDPVEVSCTPASTHSEILERHPDAVAAEPFTPTIRRPLRPMTASEKSAILAWLALIEETDPSTIAEVIGQCQQDADARDYFIWRAMDGDL